MATAETLASPRRRCEPLTVVARRENTHPSTLIRKVLKGVDPAGTGNRIRLEAIFDGGRWLIPIGALDEFYAKVTAAKLGASDTTPNQISAARERELAAVDARLDAAGI